MAIPAQLPHRRDRRYPRPGSCRAWAELLRGRGRNLALGRCLPASRSWTNCAAQRPADRGAGQQRFRPRLSRSRLDLERARGALSPRPYPARGACRSCGLAPLTVTPTGPPTKCTNGVHLFNPGSGRSRANKGAPRERGLSGARKGQRNSAARRCCCRRSRRLAKAPEAAAFQSSGPVRSGAKLRCCREGPGSLPW